MTKYQYVTGFAGLPVGLVVGCASSGTISTVASVGGVAGKTLNSTSPFSEKAILGLNFFFRRQQIRHIRKIKRKSSDKPTDSEMSQTLLRVSSTS